MVKFILNKKTNVLVTFVNVISLFLNDICQIANCTNQHITHKTPKIPIAVTYEPIW